jgi:NadR type nicotinamide-nucleotide adenylyltransferase
MHAETTGLVLGKFMPPHTGHLHLIACAAEQVDRLWVIVLSRAGEPIDGDLRCRWLEELTGPHTRILHVADDYPTDYTDPDVWRKWRRTIRAVLPTGPDLVFSSEDYGNQLAELLGAEHVMVDPARTHVPISATRIRRDPMGCWRYLPEPVRSWYVRRAVVLGGDPAIEADLAGKLGELMTAPVADPPPVGGQTIDQAQGARELAEGQIAREDRLSRQADRLLLCRGALLRLRLHARHAGARIGPLRPQRLIDRYHLVLTVEGPDLTGPRRRWWRRISRQGPPGWVFDLGSARSGRIDQARKRLSRLIAPRADS